MQYAVITDGKYRSAIAAARALGRAGYQVIVTQTRAESQQEPPVFSSRYAQGLWLEGSCTDEEYPDRLEAALRAYEHPVLLCVGAATLNMVAEQRERFARIADFLIAPRDTLDALNDKETVHRRALELGLPVPEEFSGTPLRYPVVIKPHCGEKLGLKAADRYAIARNEADYRRILDRMARYDPSPIVQEQITGDGSGVSMLFDRDGNMISAICHRRVREYPYSGGPSTCCVSDYDEARIGAARRLLESFHFTGIAMVEFKGNHILEVNPRVWGSFPLTVFAGCPFSENYALAAAGAAVEYRPGDYRMNAKMRFCVNDLAASLDCLRHGAWRQGFSGLADFFRCREALYDKTDKRAYRMYIKSYFKR